MNKTTDTEVTLNRDLAAAVEHVLQEWERAELNPEGAGVRRGMALEIRLAMRAVPKP